jgi:hypothetical protein
MICLSVAEENPSHCGLYGFEDILMLPHRFP